MPDNRDKLKNVFGEKGRLSESDIEKMLKSRKLVSETGRLTDKDIKAFGKK